MSDKIFQTEGALKAGASISAKSEGYFLMKADDIQVADGKSLAEYIDEGGGGGSGLPDYTEADNGKFLQIVDGSPAWVAITNAEEASF